MEFEINDLEIIENNNYPQTHKQSDFANQTGSANSNSLILNEIHKENEELQNKLKLNYRRLLLFETENNKLIEEKNKLFFEMKNYHEKNELLLEKNQELEKINAQIENNSKLISEKIASYEKVNKTQQHEIKRYAKFHTKIQDVVKPFIVQLKQEILTLKTQLIQAQNFSKNLLKTHDDYTKKSELEIQQKTNEILGLHAEKNSLIQTYEEQIHSFSKEIIDLQSKNENAFKEISRLKKSVEFKNYFENEVIRFKRTHEEDQNKINDLTQKKSNSEARALMLEQSLADVKNLSLQAQNKASDLEMNLEVTRTQLSKKIDELNLTHERLARLEKLNNQLSVEMSAK